MDKNEIRARLSFTHMAMRVAENEARAARDYADATRDAVRLLESHALSRALHRGMPSRAFDRYYRLHIAPLYRDSAAAETRAHESRLKSDAALAAYNRSIEAASNYTGS